MPADAPATPASSPAVAEPLPRTLFGYEVLAVIGEGAGSTIYKVRDRADDQIYALKHVRKRSSKDQRYVEQLVNELAVSEKFRHPGLRRSYEVRYRRNLLFAVKEAALVMEFFDGVPLDRQEPKPLAEVLDVFIQAAHALHGLHYLQYVHCDLKPNNVLTRPDGSGGTAVKIIDFGQAVKVGTTKARIQGTADFMAPEQVKLKPVTFRTDSFNFGATLYWALTGHRVPTLFTVSRDRRDVIKEGKFPSPRDLNDKCPQDLSDLVMECVKMSPLARPADMPQIIHRLVQVKKQVEGGRA